MWLCSVTIYTYAHTHTHTHTHTYVRTYVHIIYTQIHRAQKDAIAKDEQQQKASLTRRLQHASEVKKQVREIEQQKVNARKSFFEEGIKLDQEATERYLTTDIMFMLIVYV